MTSDYISSTFSPRSCSGVNTHQCCIYGHIPPSQWTLCLYISLVSERFSSGHYHCKDFHLSSCKINNIWHCPNNVDASSRETALNHGERRPAPARIYAALWGFLHVCATGRGHKTDESQRNNCKSGGLCGKLISWAHAGSISGAEVNQLLVNLVGRSVRSGPLLGNNRSLRRSGTPALLLKGPREPPCAELKRLKTLNLSVFRRSCALTDAHAPHLAFKCAVLLLLWLRRGCWG